MIIDNNLLSIIKIIINNNPSRMKMASMTSDLDDDKLYQL